MDDSEHQILNTQILSLEKVTDRSCGGKAFGLSQLIEIGFSVPAGFVIRNAKNQAYLADLSDFYLALESRTWLLDHQQLMRMVMMHLLLVSMTRY